MNDLSGKHILVTGASSGIGKETAVSCSRCGAKVTLIARREAELEKTIHELSGNGHSYYTADLTELDTIEALIKKIVSENGSIDGLAYCAGVSSNRPISMLPYEKIHEVMIINFYGYVEMVRAITKKGRYNCGTSIVSVSSVAAVCGNPAKTAYSASKAAMNGAMRCLASELAKKTIRCNTVLPGLINTKMYQAYHANNGNVADNDADFSDRQFLGIGEAKDVANAIIFLLSDDSRLITGVELPVDGGYSSC